MSQKRAFPTATLGLILINVLIFTFLTATGTLESAIQQYGLRPAAIVRGQGLYAPLTSMFLHGDWMHLFGNMLALLVFGIILERRIGTAKFLAIYFLAHFAAAMFDTVIRIDSWGSAYGASAAIAGVAGACFMRFPTAKAPLSFLLFLISSWIAMTLILVIPMSITAANILYILISIGLPVATFLMAPLTTAPLWPFVLMWIIFQVGFGVFATTLGIIAAGFWAHISGFFAGMILSLLLIRGLGEGVKPREEIPAIG